MLKKYIEWFESIPATILSGIALVLSFILTKLETAAFIDPAWIAVVLSGLPIIYSAVKKLFKNQGITKISSALLISIAMISAIAIGDLFAAGEVAFIMAIGEILEDMTTDKAKKGLKKLIGLTPSTGRRVKDGAVEIIPTEDIRSGDIIRILPGERIPVDGEIISGDTTVDQSVMTGESLPLDKTAGDSVFCGTLNCFGAIDIVATDVGENSSLSKLIRLVEEAESNKAPMARTADKCAALLVPLALLIAIITFAATKDIVRAVTVLVVFCPCALVLATPTAIMAAIGQATKRGIIIKSGEALEKMGKINEFAFDKTGTLTFGRPEVCDVKSLEESFSEVDILRFAAAVETKSEHPLGKAIVEFAASSKNISFAEAIDFTMTSGRGVAAIIEGKQVHCGNESYMVESGIKVSEEATLTLKQYHKESKATILVAIDRAVCGIIALSDGLRPEAEATVNKLQAMKIGTFLLTGDNSLTAEYFAKTAGIDKVYGELLPNQKVEKILELQQKGKWVCMIGDGVNDAPSLKTADVGIAMGSMGSDIAVEAADISLISDDLSSLPYLKRLSKATVNTIRLSITLSMAINILAVALSVMGVLNPTLGALVHNAGSVFVVMIAAMLYDRKFN